MKHAILLFTVLAGVTQAQTITKPLGSEPGINWRLGADIAYDDNVFRTAALTESDNYLAIKPELAWYGFSGPNQFDLTFKGDFRRHQDLDEADYSAWRIGGYALLDHTARLSTDYTLGYEDGIETLGSLPQFFVPGQGPNEFERLNGAWTIRYGATDAAGQLRGQVRYSEQRFQNNDQEFRDQDQIGFTGTFFYRVAPRTRVLLELDYTEFDFVEEDIFGFNQSGERVQYLTGATWEATANTTGELRIGYRDQSFDQGSFQNLSGLALDLSLTWTPSELTTVNISAQENNQTAPVQGVGGFVQTGFGVDLTRSTGARSRIVADVAFDRQQFEGGFSRDDDWWRAAVGIEYDLTSRLSTRLEYRYEDRSSNFAPFNFEANVVLLSFTLTPPI